MNSKLVTGFIFMGVLVFPGLGLSSETGPAEIDLKARFHIEGKKEAVIFPHATHQKTLECISCHADPKGGKLKVAIVNISGSGNDFHKKLCWPCHEEKQVPKGKSCSTCHKK